MLRLVSSLPTSALLTTLALAPVSAYPIDCAILLCMAGGFPASAECGAARAEMIRRVTPWPIEPPLQLWRCPMGGGIGAASNGSFGQSPEIRQYRDGIEVWEINDIRGALWSEPRSFSRVYRHVFDEDGDAHRLRVAPENLPQEVRADLVSYLNEARISPFRIARGVLLRTHDHEGNAAWELVDY